MNININRRELLNATIPTLFVGGSVAALVGCNGGGNFNSGLSSAVADVQLIATGLSTAVTQLSALNIPGLTPATLAKVNTAVGQVQTVAAALGASASATQAQPLIGQLEAAINTLVSTAAGLPLPPNIQLPIAAAAVLLPIIETAIGIAVSTVVAAQAAKAQTVVSATPSAAPGVQPADVARGILRNTK